MPMELLINQKKYSTDAAPERMLLWVLRDELGLTGTKYGCGEAQCGACTVLLDGEPVRSCVTPLRAVEGREITTIEGLEHDGHLHPLQETFLMADAMQCGYCTPGMIMGVVGLLRENAHPTEDDIKTRMQRHLCRCCNYPKLVKAIYRAAELHPAK